jgi:prepilin-type N-terminal cleavage/methylation domain-containing protein
MPHRRCAFTLVELLVVVAIIALLISILLPALKQAKAIAVSVTCSSQLKQTAMATHLYAEDNEGFGPSTTWPPIAVAYLNLQGPPFPLACPAKPYGTTPPGYYTPRPWASNISLNRSLDDDCMDGGAASNSKTNGVTHPPGVNYWSQPYRRVQDPAGTTMFFDALLVSEQNSSLPTYTYASEFGYGWLSLDYRHPGGGGAGMGNVVFVDQHVESVFQASPSMWTPILD